MGKDAGAAARQAGEVRRLIRLAAQEPQLKQGLTAGFGWFDSTSVCFEYSMAICIYLLYSYELIWDNCGTNLTCGLHKMA